MKLLRLCPTRETFTETMKTKFSHLRNELEPDQSQPVDYLSQVDVNDLMRLPDYGENINFNF